MAVFFQLLCKHLLDCSEGETEHVLKENQSEPVEYLRLYSIGRLNGTLTMLVTAK